VMNAAKDLLRFLFIEKQSLNHCKFLIMADILSIYRVEIALAQTEVMNSIEQVGFTNAVIAYKAIDARRKSDLCCFNIFKVNQRKRLQVHIRK